ACRARHIDRRDGELSSLAPLHVPPPSPLFSSRRLPPGSMKTDAPAANGQPRTLRRLQGIVDEVFELIRADSMALRIPPASRISIDQLARQLGVSQTPIREALSRLEATGLVTKRHFVGYCCAQQLDRRQLDELYELRLLLEPYAARCAAQ